MTKTDPQALIERLVTEVYSRGHLDSIYRLFSSSVLINGRPYTPELIKESMEMLHNLDSGLRITINEISVMADYVITDWTFQHATPPGLSPRRSLRLYRIAEDGINEVWFDWAARERLTALEDAQDW